VSKNIITEKIGKPVKYFCYPNARYRNDNAYLIQQAGYEYAFRIHNLCLNENQGRYFIPRYLLNERVCHNKNYLLCRLLNIPKF
jgi:peptidoglycan/xylan/chitin deacetylase (PgdA/CDA1 family)